LVPALPRCAARLAALTLVAPWSLAARDADVAGQLLPEQRVELDRDGYHFDTSLFRGSSVSPEVVQRVARAEVPAGVYKADVHLNGRFVDSADIRIAPDQRGGTQTCLERALVEQARLVLRPEVEEQAADGAQDCVVFEQAVEGGKARFDLSSLRLELEVPSASLVSVPRGHVDAKALDAGATMAYVNYNGSHYRVSHDTSNQDFGYLLLDMGFNHAGWQLRQQSSLIHGQSGTDWNTLRQYLQRPLPSLRSQLVLGETFTSGRILSGLAYTGVSLSSDERMLPDSMRGYAPTVRGIAMTSARVSIRQNGHEIHQVTVAPGPFEIRDLYPTNFNGDLDVEVMEADGTTRRFSVPFAAVPESLRPGSSRYSLVLGRTRDMGKDSVFLDGSYQRGISNRITGLAALRASDGYQALVLGGALASGWGAFGLNITYARAELPAQGIQDGWMAHASYSRTFTPTRTTLSLAGYRYSTEGYRDLADVLGLRRAIEQGWQWVSSSYRQQQRFELALNQSLGRHGSLFVTGSTQRYRDGRRRDSQFQFGYGNAFANGVSINLSVARQHNQVAAQVMGWQSDVEDALLPPAWRDVGSRRETTVSLSISVPLGRAGSSRAPSLTTAYARSGDGESQYQASLSGMADRAQTLSYSLGASRSTTPSSTTLSASLNKRMPRLSLGINASRGDGYWQAGANLQGAIVAHGGGVTFGPYLGETFGLIEAKGAVGARMSGNHGVRVDRNGYALLPSLTPYRYNSIALDPGSLDERVELLDGARRVAPYAGAGAKVVFRTRPGLPLLVDTGSNGVVRVPMGAEVFDAEGGVVGVAGQGGQVYARVDAPVGVLDVRWGKGQGCRIHYDARAHADQPLARVAADCDGS